ncbi:MAG: glycosyltransferase N-terminal domain-containing protein [Pseudomonadota bacterium]
MPSDFLIKPAFFIYNICWKIIIPLLHCNKRLAEGFSQRTFKEEPLRADLWIQAASAGEAYLAVEILKKLKFNKPVNILLTSGTKQGMDILESSIKDINDKNIVVNTSFFFFDQPGLMEKVVNKINPKLMILLESELWPGHLLALKKSGCKTIIINGRITDKSLKQYLIFKSFWKEIAPDKIYAISDNDAKRFAMLFGNESVEVMPNIKFDRFGDNEVKSDIQNPIEVLFQHNAPFIVLASIRKKEEPLIENIITDILKKIPDAIIGLFPRHMNRIRPWGKALGRINIKWALRSKAKNHIPKGTVILWDTFGELLHAYKYARAAFVGGSLVPLGGQNFIEALNYGIVPVIGPHWDNFSWVGKEIAEEKLVRVAANWQEAADILNEHISNPLSREKIKSAASQYFKHRQGGAAFAGKIITDFLEKTAS